MNPNRNQEIKLIGLSDGFHTAEAPQLSVLLPTYNRAEALHRTLQGLEQQSADKATYEVIVVDDGSDDRTPEVLEQFTAQTGLLFRYVLLKENGGPARARNIGLSMIRGKAVFITGDDIEPSETLVERHLQFHQQHSEKGAALLGYVSFPEALDANPFMRWLATQGRAYFFNYADLTPGKEAGPLFFYTCNVSVKTSLLEQTGWFDESFPYASHEDLELGCRLAEQGMRLIYEPAAEGFHWHLLTVQGITRRVYLMGYSARLFWAKVKQQDGILKRSLRRILVLCCSAPWGIWAWNWLRKQEYSGQQAYPVQWRLLLFLSFFIGLADGYKNREIRV
ncbi:MAG: glycosyltransferase family 2 protein [Candidatus Electrothrix sp. GW3-4]|uniref:glycosyltransferase family 2 protein n=1 Tax=Candidatus Electrothrix sp. GW3-4 TaxID=3126740 RepID=UPI0030CAB823